MVVVLQKHLDSEDGQKGNVYVLCIFDISSYSNLIKKTHKPLEKNIWMP
jgi:hypothetical protein